MKQYLSILPVMILLARIPLNHSVFLPILRTDFHLQYAGDKLNILSFECYELIQCPLVKAVKMTKGRFKNGFLVVLGIEFRASNLLGRCFFKPLHQHRISL
jgi:hypothetical protein